MRFVQTQTLSLRTAIARLTPCASSTRKRYRLFGYKPHFRAAAGSPCRSRYRFARFGECGFYLKNTMHLLRILWNNSECLPHKADAHVEDVRVSIPFDHEQSESNMPSLIALGKVAMC